jgi:hypothetical protein
LKGEYKQNGLDHVEKIAKKDEEQKNKIVFLKGDLD